MNQITSLFFNINQKRSNSMYECFWKRLIDIFLSLLALIFLSWLFIIIAVVIALDDPGPVMFRQKRIGIHKSFFWLPKFRTMKQSAPHDVPTHLFDNPEKYMTRIGHLLRKYSLDELPQLWSIFTGKMAIVGPRPALWNQDDLICEREKYGANDIRPGLTGWAQINGRDELTISDKAKLDGEYTAKLKEGGICAFRFDLHCFFRTFFTVVSGEGFLEGATNIKENNISEK